MTLLFANNPVSTLAVTALLSDTSLQVASGQGARFPSPGDGEEFVITVQNGTLFEIMRCTGRSGDILTVARGEEGTAAQTWNVGSSVEMRVTAGTLASFAQEADVAAAYVPLDTPIVLPADPTLAEQAATKRYIDTQVATLVSNAMKNTFAHMIGAIEVFAGFITPPGWLECGGQQVSRSTYALLHAQVRQSNVVSTTAGSATVTTSLHTWSPGYFVEIPGFPLNTYVASTPAVGQMVMSQPCAATQTNVTGYAYPYGAGDGSTTFNLPDLRGFTIAGWGWLGGNFSNQLGVVDLNQSARIGGRMGNALMQLHNHGHTDPKHTHTVTVTSAGGHSHQAPTPAPDATDASGPFPVNYGGIGFHGNYTTHDGDHTHTVTLAAAETGMTNIETGGGNQQNVQPTAVERILIYTGVG